MKGAVLAFGALVLATPGVGSQSPAAPVEIRLEPSSITVGDPVQVTVRLALSDRDSAGRARLVVPEPRWGSAEILSPPVQVGDGTVGAAPRTWTFTITAFETGRIELPPLELRLGDDPPRRLWTAGGAELEVLSVLPAGAAEITPAPAVPPRPLPVPVAFWWSAGALAGATFVTALALAGRERRGRKPAIEPRRPLAELGAELERLGGSDVGIDHARLSAALRRYLGRRCGFPALESTTTEVARRLVANRIERSLAGRIRSLLADCDGIKFARRGAATGDLEERRSRALDLAREIEHALAPAPSEPDS